MKTLVLVGGGHAHLHCLEQLNNHALEDTQVLLISASRYQYYSGMFSGFTEGVYSLQDIRIDLAELCGKVGAVFIEDAVETIDPENKTLTCASGEMYGYDLVSFDIGSQIDIPRNFLKHIASIKPNYRFPDRLKQLRETAHPVIIGGGASGVELALAIQAWRRRHNLPLNTVLISSSALLLGLGRASSKKIEAVSQKKGLACYTGAKVESIDSQTLATSDGKSVTQSDVLWLTGPKSAELFTSSGLPTDDGGYLLVDETLHSVTHPDIYGAGDCVSIQRFPGLAKNGVYAVRQGPVLWHNLMASLTGGNLKKFTPQKRFVSILSTGDGEAFLSYGEKSFHGKIPWSLKQRIDRQFMKRYHELYCEN
ncbi:FAD-dependent oxidoreductase [Planococcus dechangensis]|uniref:FAD-dependent oxidoreductase n=1 Tax=Planococcus dechangensis TaxID=1176255 RepID=A0ABV9M8D4_9BACL